LRFNLPQPGVSIIRAAPQKEALLPSKLGVIVSCHGIPNPKGKITKGSSNDELVTRILLSGWGTATSESLSVLA
jgi:hypothetical protein